MHARLGRCAEMKTKIQNNDSIFETALRTIEAVRPLDPETLEHSKHLDILPATIQTFPNTSDTTKPEQVRYVLRT